MKVETAWQTDPVMELGYSVLNQIANGYDGEQVMQGRGVSVDVAMAAVAEYAARILRGVEAPAPTAECRPSYSGWCYPHGVFHPAPEPPSP